MDGNFWNMSSSGELASQMGEDIKVVSGMGHASAEMLISLGPLTLDI